jgi:Tripartite tricarboxylate transporter family receptor
MPPNGARLHQAAGPYASRVGAKLARATDPFHRLICSGRNTRHPERIGSALSQQIFVENRPGSGNIIGAEVAARATPDGYTFYWATAAALVTNPYTFKSLPYDPFRDFVPVGKVAMVRFWCWQIRMWRRELCRISSRWQRPNLES